MEIMNIGQISGVWMIHVWNGRKYQMADRDVENLKNMIKELSKTVKEEIDENEQLRNENKLLKHQIEYLKSVFENAYKPENPESAMRKTGLFSEEEICEMMRENEKISQDFEKTVSEDGINQDTLIAELQSQHQQDCIRINDLTTTVHVLAGLYSTLRKNVGMD